MEKVNKRNYIDLLATKIAEVRLSELGYRLIPGIYPIFRRVRQCLEAKAKIIKFVPQEV